MKVAIVGAGIAGLSTAWALAARGHEVKLVEQGPIPNPLSASGDHHRIIRRAYPPGSGYGAMISEAYEAWEALWGDLGQRHYDPRGFACISRAAGDEAEDYARGLEAGGWPHERLDAGEACRRWPFLAPETIRYAVFSNEGGALHSRRIAAGIARWLRHRGARILDHTRVETVDCAAGRLRLASRETVEADRLVVTAGAWVTKLLPEFSGTLQPKRTAVVYLEPPADLKSAWDSAPVFLDVGGGTDGYIIPPSGGGGLKFGSGLSKRDNPDADLNREMKAGDGEAIRDLFAPPVARLGAYVVREAASCVYTFTRDERFFAARQGKATIVSACSGHGYKFGAAIGRRVAAAVEADDSDGLASWLRGEGG